MTSHCNLLATLRVVVAAVSHRMKRKNLGELNWSANVNPSASFMGTVV